MASKTWKIKASVLSQIQGLGGYSAAFQDFVVTTTDGAPPTYNNETLETNVDTTLDKTYMKHNNNVYGGLVGGYLGDQGNTLVASGADLLTPTVQFNSLTLWNSNDPWGDKSLQSISFGYNSIMLAFRDATPEELSFVGGTAFAEEFDGGGGGGGAADLPTEDVVLVGDKVMATIEGDPRTNGVTYNSLPLEAGSIVKNSVDGQKFIAGGASATDFAAIEITPKAEWGWSAGGETAWAVLQAKG